MIITVSKMCSSSSSCCNGFTQKGSVQHGRIAADSLCTSHGQLTCMYDLGFEQVWNVFKYVAYIKSLICLIYFHYICSLKLTAKLSYTVKSATFGMFFLDIMHFLTTFRSFGSWSQNWVNCILSICWVAQVLVRALTLPYPGFASSAFSKIIYILWFSLVLCSVLFFFQFCPFFPFLLTLFSSYTI